jgi:hypothetical protein
LIKRLRVDVWFQIRGSYKEPQEFAETTLSYPFQIGAYHQPNKLRRNMRTLRKLSTAVILITAVFVMPALAGQTMTPCPPPDPGQTMTPCDPGSPAASGDMGTSTGTSTADMGTPTVANDETSFTEIAAKMVLNFLPLF